MKCIKDKSFQCEGPIPELCQAKVLNIEEEAIIDLLCQVWSIFIKLDTQHPDELDEFRYRIHDLQRIVAMRGMQRLYPNEWTNVKETNHERNSCKKAKETS